MIFLRIFVPVLISIACLYFASRNVQWEQLKTILTGAKLVPIVLGMSISLITFWLRAFRWQILLQPFQQISTLILFRWQVGGLLINNMFPLRMGELARAYWAGHKSAISKSSILATIVIERSLDVASIALIAVILLFSMGIYSWNRFFNSEGGITLLLILVVLGFLTKFITSRYKHDQLLIRLRRFFPEKAVAILEKFFTGLQIIKDKKQFAKVILLSPLIWCMDILILLIVSRSLEMTPPLTWMQSGLTMVGLVLGVMVPAAPGAAGTYEAGGVAALSLMGFEKTLAFSFILLLHSAQYLFVLLIGIPILIVEGFNPKKLFETMKHGSGV